MIQPNIDAALSCLNLALQTINGWTLDENGRALVHPDVILKTINAAIYNLESHPEEGIHD